MEMGKIGPVEKEGGELSMKQSHHFSENILQHLDQRALVEEILAEEPGVTVEQAALAVELAAVMLGMNY